MTALHIAAKFSTEEMLKKLLDKRLDATKSGGVSLALC